MRFCVTIANQTTTLTVDPDQVEAFVRALFAGARDANGRALCFLDVALVDDQPIEYERDARGHYKVGAP